MDYYIENPERLEGQPKRTIADYVEQNGILVPRRFDSLAEARKSHKTILLRSEHLQEYSGVSGLLNSFELSSTVYPVRDSKDVEEVKERYFAYINKEGEASLYKDYCSFLRLNEDDFKDEVSFSIWECLGGFNRTVVADSAISGRYHVMTHYSTEEKSLSNYAIVEDKKIAQEFINPLPKELRNDLGNLIELYEIVRNLDRFNPNHCPIMEFQTYKRKNYFLQYHRARNFSPSEFTLERALEDGEIEVPFVRGATTKEGMDCKVTVYYATGTNENFDPDIEDGSYDFHYNIVFTELRVRERKVQITNSRRLDMELNKFIVGHLKRSKLFKPQVSIVHNMDDVLDEKSIDDFYEGAKQGRNSYLDLHIVSDGRRCFIRRIC